MAKKKDCTYTDTKSVTAVKVIPGDVPERISAPSASSDTFFTPGAFILAGLEPCAVGKHIDDGSSLNISSGIYLAAPPDLAIANHNWLDDTGQFVDQFSSSSLQDIFYDWNIPPGCDPLDFTSTFSPIYASTETTPLGIISDPTHILTPSAYLEPDNAHRSAGELERYCMFLIYRVSPSLLTHFQSKLLSSCTPTTSPFCTPRGGKMANLLFF